MTGKAQAAWDSLNPRQQAYLHVLFHHDQAAEEQRAADWASGRTMDDRTPAAEWRSLGVRWAWCDVALAPSLGRLRRFSGGAALR